MVEQTKLVSRTGVEKRIEAALEALNPAGEWEGPLLARYTPYQKIAEVPAGELGGLCAALENETRIREYLGEDKYYASITVAGKLALYKAALNMMETTLQEAGYMRENGVTFSRWKAAWNACLKDCNFTFSAFDVEADETPPKTSEKQRKKTGKTGRKKTGKKKSNPPTPMEQKNVLAVVQYLNKKTGRSFKPNTDSTRRHILARLREGYTLDDFVKVVDDLATRWNHPPMDGSPDMRRYLRPETMFGGKFEGYLNDARMDGNSPAGDILAETTFNPIKSKGEPMLEKCIAQLESQQSAYKPGQLEYRAAKHRVCNEGHKQME